MAKLVETLRYKSKSRGSDSRECHLHNPSGRTMALGLTQPLTEMSKGKDKVGLCVGLTTLQPSCVNYLKMWEPQSPGTLWACSGL